MSKDKQLGRRRFLGATAAVVGGAGLVGAVTLGGGSRRGAARFEELEGFPDAPVAVEVSFDGTLGERAGRVELFVVTPRETLAYDLGAVRLERGSGRVELAMVYPYDELVSGRYDYHVKVTAGSAVVATDAPAGYSVRALRWFA